MSYILDALRRAETERDRGQVPGLNAQPAAAPARPLPSGRPSAARWLGMMGVAWLVAVLAWWLWPRGEVSPPASAGAAAPAAPVAPPPETVPPPAPAPVRLPVVVSAPPPPAAIEPARPPVPAPAPPPTAAEPRTLALASLTPEQRRDWPALAIGGAVYSDNPASRFVVIGGQLVREGDAAAPGVIVERITPRSVVLRWRELRVEVPL